MAVAKYSTLSTRSSNLAGTSLNSLANNTASAFITYDNSTTRDLYAIVTVKLGSFTPTAGANITLRVYTTDGTDTPDINGGSFDSYITSLTTTTSAKVATFPLVRLYPASLRIQIVNNSGVSLPSSGNEIYFTNYNEDVT